MLTSPCINIPELFAKGYTTVNIQKPWADRILKEMKNQSWVEVVPDVIDASGNIDKYYENRYISAQSMLQPDHPIPLFKRYMDSFMKWSGPAISRYEAGHEYHVSAFCGLEGYYMEPHSDVGDRSILDIVAYFGDDIGDRDDGGCLNFYRVDLCDPENEDKMSLIESIVPEHGMVVVFNNMNPSVYHEVTKLTKKGCKRFQLIAQAGILNKPDWFIEFESEKGFYKHDSDKAILGDTDSVLRILKEGTVYER